MVLARRFLFDMHRERVLGRRGEDEHLETKSQPELTSNRERLQRIREALDTLRPELREAVILRDFQDMDANEISQVLNVSALTVRRRIAKGRDELARLVQDAGGDIEVSDYPEQADASAAPSIELSAAELEAAQAKILRRAIEVIGGEAEAMRWMGTPVRALDYATPISLLHNLRGFEEVKLVLGRLEHGIL